MSVTSLETWRRAAAELLFPPSCALCGRQSLDGSVGDGFCPDCCKLLEQQPIVACGRCAMPCPTYQASAGRCVHCQSLKLRFDSALTLGPYEGTLRQVVLKVKHPEFESLSYQVAALLARRLCESPPATPFDLVACVPMHWLRRWWRGGSAAECLARRVARELRLPCYADLLRCRRLLRRQSTLSPPQRRRNVRRAYQVSPGFDIGGSHILLIDDVLTTGATANECSRALRLAGAATITVAALARGSGELT